jgi:hypothetical protein
MNGSIFNLPILWFTPWSLAEETFLFVCLYEVTTVRPYLIIYRRSQGRPDEELVKGKRGAISSDLFRLVGNRSARRNHQPNLGGDRTETPSTHKAHTGIRTRGLSGVFGMTPLRTEPPRRPSYYFVFYHKIS